MIKAIKVKELIKYLVIIVTIIVMIVLLARYFFYKKQESDTKFKISKLELNNKFSFISCFNISMPITNLFDKTTYKEEISKNKQIRKNESTSRSGFVRILDLELPNIEEIEEDEYNEVDKTNENKDEETAKKVDIKDTYTNQYKTVKVKNLTKIKLTESILKPDYNVKNKKNIIIYHTHTCESYTATSENNYKATGNYRTTDLRYSVVKVGDVLEKELKSKGFKVSHNNEKHDYPAYSGSYSRSLKTVEEILEKQKDTQIVFDIHRDAVGSKGTYGPTVEINGKKVAQLMFVIGTNDGGANHPNWERNLKFAVKVQEKANEMYPGLFRAINLRSAAFNQKITDAASIIEVGATGNTLEEAEASMKYLANVLKEVL